MVVKENHERDMHFFSLGVEEEKELAVVKKDQERDVQKNFL